MLHVKLMWSRLNTAAGKLKSPTGDKYKGKKELVHCCRYLMFAIQITKYGKIFNYSAANTLQNEIMQNSSTDWPQYLSNVSSIVTELKEALKTSSESQKMYGRIEHDRNTVLFLVDQNIKQK